MPCCGEGKLVDVILVEGLAFKRRVRAVIMAEVQISTHRYKGLDIRSLVGSDPLRPSRRRRGDHERMASFRNTDRHVE